MIGIKSFSGEFPRQKPHLLPDNAATIAIDCDFTQGVLTGIRERSLVPGLAIQSGVKSIYVHDGMVNSLYAWTRDVDCVRGPSPSDKFNRFYWSDGSGFYVSRGDVGGNGQEPSSTNRYKVGCPTPAQAMTIGADTLLALPNVLSVDFTAFCEGSDGSVASEMVLPQPTMTSHTVDSYSGEWNVSISCSTGSSSGSSGSTSGGVTSLEYFIDSSPWDDRGVASSAVRVVMRDTSASVPTYYIHNDDYLNVPFGDEFTVSAGTVYRSGEGIVPNLIKFYSVGKGWYCSNKDGEIPDGAVDSGSSAELTSTAAVKAIFNMDGGGTQTAILRLNGEHTMPSDFSAWAWTLTAESGKISYSLVAKNQYKEYRAYAYSYVNQYGEESGLSAPVEIDVVEGQSVNLSYTPLPDSSGYCPISFIRIYRTATGSGGTDYSFVDEILVNSTAPKYTDIKAGDELGAPSQSSSFEAPPQTLRGLCMMGNGILTGFVGNELYFMEPYLPYAYKPNTIKPLPNKIIGICPTDDGLYVTTTAHPYLITGVSPDAMTDRRIPAIQAGVSKGSICSIGATVAYASHDGIVLLRGIDASLELSFKFFTRETWRDRYANKLSVMRINAHDGNIVVWFDDGTPGFLIRTEEGALSMTDLADPIYSAFVYSLADALYVTAGSGVYEFKGSNSTKSFRWTSKDFILPKPANFGCIQIVGYGSVSFSVSADGEVKHSQSVTIDASGTNVYRLPAGFLSRRWSFDLTGQGGARIDEVYMASSPTELQNA